MAYWLAKPGDGIQKSWVKRFDPRFWTVNFPRPMMAAVTTTRPNALRVDTFFYKTNDLAGLIWEAEDRFDHPLLAYETARDFSGLTLKFHWLSSGLTPLDGINGPTLTIEGRDQSGATKSWYVRIWNYADGTPTNADVILDFDAMEGGFLLPGEADPVWAGDIDRMFISLVPPGYTGTTGNLAQPVEAWVTLDNISCDGPGSVLEIGDTLVPQHGLGIASGYDDSYNLTPARLLRNMLHLGYRGSINHYVGMSHYFRLEPLGDGQYVSLAGGALNTPCAVWHSDFAFRAKALDFSLILSLSYELFDAHCWSDWKQRAFNGDPAQTGWVPPSTLLSPAHVGAMGYLQAVARAFVAIATGAGQAPRFQIGEPWWWVMPDGRICLYDDAARLAFGGAPVEIANVGSLSLTGEQKNLLDAAGGMLAASTQALVEAVKIDHPACETLLLVYLPTIFDEQAPEAKRANAPVGWASPAFDILQLEEYDWVTSGNAGASARALAVAQTRFNYPANQRHYLSGFVLAPVDRGQWSLIDRAARTAKDSGVAESFIWALPQVMRDGFTSFDLGDDDVQSFDDLDFPLDLGMRASVTPGFSTAIVTSASGHEQRNVDWASGRLRYDVGPGARSDDDLQVMIAFFRARRGAARGFRLRDPVDHSSNGMTGMPQANNQILGTGDGVRTQFPLIKRYGAGEEAEVRKITRPLSGSIEVAVDGIILASGWSLQTGGVISFTLAPAIGAPVTAGFLFDVPVRFAEDSLSIDSITFQAGDVPSVPLVEIREK